MGKNWDESNYYIGKDNMSEDRIKEIFNFFIDKFEEYYGIDNLAKFELIMTRSAKKRHEIEMITKDTKFGEATFDLDQKSNIKLFDLPNYKPLAYKRITKSILKVTRSITTYFLTQTEFKNKEFGPSLKKLNDQLSGTDDEFNSAIKKDTLAGVALVFDNPRDSDFISAMIKKSVHLFGDRHEWLLRILFAFVCRKPLVTIPYVPMDLSSFVSMSREDFDRFFLLTFLLLDNKMPVHIVIEFAKPELLTILAFYFSFKNGEEKLVRLHRFGSIEFFSIAIPKITIYPNHREFYGVVEESITGDNFMKDNYRCFSFKSNSSGFDKKNNIRECRYDKFAYTCTGYEEGKPVTYLVDETQTNPICYFPLNSPICIEIAQGKKITIMDVADDPERETREQLSEGDEFVTLKELVTFNYLNASLDLILSKSWIIKPNESIKFFVRNVKTKNVLTSFCLRSRYLRVGLVLGSASYQADHDATLFHVYNIGTKEIDTGNRFLTIIICQNFSALPSDDFIEAAIDPNFEYDNREEISDYSYNADESDRYDFVLRGVKVQIKNKEKKQKVKQVTAKTNEEGVVEEVRCAKRKADIEEASKETQEPEIVPVYIQNF